MVGQPAANPDSESGLPIESSRSRCCLSGLQSAHLPSFALVLRRAGVRPPSRSDRDYGGWMAAVAKLGSLGPREMIQKCLACGVEKDASIKEVYPYPEDRFIDEPIDPFMT